MGDLSATVPTFAGLRSINPVWRITHSESAKALIQAICASTQPMMTRLGTRRQGHALLIRDAVARLGSAPEWRLEVADESGTVRYLFRLTAENFKH
jgi:hypothetical protein